MTKISQPKTPTFKSAGAFSLWLRWKWLSSVQRTFMCASFVEPFPPCQRKKSPRRLRFSSHFSLFQNVPSHGAGSRHFLSKRHSGFTLVEILVVLGLIGLILSLAVPSVGMALKVNISNSARELATVIRNTRDEAVLKGQVYRVAFDLDRNQYWVEAGNRDFLMRSTEQEEKERKRDERRTEEEKAKHKEPFQLAQSVTKKKKSLPMGVKFTEILTTRSKEVIKGGMVYAHVFPFGFVEHVVVHLKDDFDREATLAVNSVTGKSRLFQSYVKDAD